LSEQAHARLSKVAGVLRRAQSCPIEDFEEVASS